MLRLGDDVHAVELGPAGRTLGSDRPGGRVVGNHCGLDGDTLPLDPADGFVVTFLPGALLTMATVDLAMGGTGAGGIRFVAALIELALLGIGIVVGVYVYNCAPKGSLLWLLAVLFATWI